MKKELIGIIVCVLLVGVSVLPNITAEKLYLTNEEFGTEEKNIPPNPDGIFDIIF